MHFISITCVLCLDYLQLILGRVSDRDFIEVLLYGYLLSYASFCLTNCNRSRNLHCHAYLAPTSLRLYLVLNFFIEPWLELFIHVSLFPVLSSHW